MENKNKEEVSVEKEKVHRLTGEEWKAEVDARAKKYAKETNNVKKSKSGKRTPLDYSFGTIGVICSVFVGALLGIIYFYKFGYFFEERYEEVGGILLMLATVGIGGFLGLFWGVVGLFHAEAHDGRGKFISGLSIIMAMLFIMVATLWFVSQLIALTAGV